MMDRATFRWKKGADGRTTLTVRRVDGSTTWAKLHPFLPLHDLLHYAVETTLNFSEAFFGLVTSGWGLEEFGQPGRPGQLPPQAIIAEHIVGLFDQERATKHAWSPETLNDALEAALPDRPFTPVSDDDIENIRQQFMLLEKRWHATKPGGTFELRWPPEPDGVPSGHD